MPVMSVPVIPMPMQTHMPVSMVEKETTLSEAAPVVPVAISPPTLA